MGQEQLQEFSYDSSFCDEIYLVYTFLVCIVEHEYLSKFKISSIDFFSNILDNLFMRAVFKKVYKLYKTPEYDAWLEHQTLKSQVQIADRLSKIELEGYFGI